MDTIERSMQLHYKEQEGVFIVCHEWHVDNITLLFRLFKYYLD